MQPRLAVSRIIGFDLWVRDPERSLRFYREVLGFADADGDPAGGVPGARLGDVELRLIATAPGAPPRAPAAANAPDFQHFAIRVSDMAAAYARVTAFDPQSISRGGPQRLPPVDGSVIAWKFRDPDGHPLELLQFPQGTSRAAPSLFEIVDHTALACADTSASIAFYESLGFAQGPPSLNHGAPQDRLDGLAGVDLHIATLHTPAAGPHIELLHYRHPSPLAGVGRSHAPFVRTRVLTQGPSGSFTDPDGHLISALTSAGGD